MTTIKVQVKADHVQRMVSGKKPVSALSEVIWNALDADATDVRISFDQDLSGTISTIEVVDNGTGISEIDASSGFGALGGSWKQTGGMTKKFRRLLHGKTGQGRFQAFALGTDVTWNSTFESQSNAFRDISIRGQLDNLLSFESTEPRDSVNTSTRTVVTIREIVESSNQLLSEQAPERNH